MHVRRIACFLLGAWLAGCLTVTLLGTQDPEAAPDVLLNLSAAAAAQFHSVAPPVARSLLRFAAAERNRTLMERWDTVQVGYGACFFLFLLFGSREGKWSLGLALWMIAMALLQRLYITPESSDIGRMADFLPPASTTVFRTKVLVLQEAYWLVEAAKWMAGLTLAGKLLWFSGRSGDAGENVHVVHKADHRHIYR